MGLWDTIKDYAVPDDLVDYYHNQRALAAAARAQAAAARARAAAAAARQAGRVARGEPSLSVAHAPTVADAGYNAVGSGWAAANRAMGADERTAAWRGENLRQNVRELGENLTGLGHTEEASTRLARGKGDGWDVAQTALGVLPFVPEVGGMVGAGIRAASPAPVRRAASRAADWLAAGHPLSDATSFEHGGADVLYPDHPDVPSLRVVNAPRVAGPSGRVAGVEPFREALPAPAARPAQPRLGYDAPPPTPLLTDESEQLIGGVKPRGGQWFPNVRVRPYERGEDVGWFVHDRGEHAPGDMRWLAQRGDNTQSARYFSNEDAARRHGDVQARLQRFNWSPEGVAEETAASGLPDEASGEIHDWLSNALAKYYKSDLGTANDPIRALAAQGLHWDPQMTPGRWDDVVRSSLAIEPRGKYSVPTHGLPAGDIGYDEKWTPQVLEAAPWLRKPGDQTEPLYSLKSQIPMRQLLDVIPQITDPYADLPARLKVDPDKLGKISFPEMARRGGEAIQHLKEVAAEDARQSFTHPAVKFHQTYGEAPGPMPLAVDPEREAAGLPPLQVEPKRDAAWLEFQKPEPSMDLLPDDDRRLIEASQRGDFSLNPATVRGAMSDASEQELRKALKTEGRRQNICVGKDQFGYCEKVMTGDGRIFSLRDKTGMPRVTVETEKGDVPWEAHGSGAIPDESELADVWNNYMFRGPTTHERSLMNPDDPRAARPDADQFPAHVQANYPHLYDPAIFERGPDHIVQIKGWGNQRPGSELQPVDGIDPPKYEVPLDEQQYISDFVKGGDWGHIGELGHTNLVRTPGTRPGGTGTRVLDRRDVYKVLNSLPATNEWGPTSPHYWQDMLGKESSIPGIPKVPSGFSEDDWAALEPYFKGYKDGGPVRKVDQKLVAAARKRYPFIGRYNPIVVPGEGKGWAETYPPGEEGTEDRPRPKAFPLNRLGVEVYEPSFGVEDLAGEIMHVDPRANAVRDGLLSSMTDEQLAQLRRGSRDYQMTLDEGEGEANAMRNAADSAVRGYAVGQWPPEANARMNYNPGQRKALDDLRVYIGER